MLARFPLFRTNNKSGVEARVMVASHERKGATNHFEYGICDRDSRYKDRPGMQGIIFNQFPNFKREQDKC